MQNKVRLGATVLLIAIAAAVPTPLSGLATTTAPTLLDDAASQPRARYEALDRARAAMPSLAVWLTNRTETGRTLLSSCFEFVDVQVDGDACALLLAVSVSGNAVALRGLAVSGFGDAAAFNGGAALSGVGNAQTAQCDLGTGCLAVSGTGDAANSSHFCGNTGYELQTSAGVGCVAISGTGDASNDSWGCGFAGRGFTASGAGIGCLAVSGTGTASNTVGACGVAGGHENAGVGCIAISGGHASNSGGGTCGYNATGYTAGCIAVGATGDARNHADCAITWSGVATGCFAVSGTGSAANSGHACAYGAEGGRAIGCIAASGAGVASNTTDEGSCTGTIAVGNRCVSIQLPGAGS